MQESIIILCLASAVAYLGYTFYRKIRQKNTGCCGCSGECCSKQHNSCANDTPVAAREIVASQSSTNEIPSARKAQKSV